MPRLVDRTPVTILTGFLGAGKSTLLNRLIKHEAMADCAVIINEFGEVGIDHLLVQGSGDNFIELSNGCLCCTVRGELIDTLADLKDREQTGRIRPLRRVVIETTGMADPGPVIQSVIGHPAIATAFAVDGVVTLVDAVNGLSTLERHEEARRQVALADRLVLSKASLGERGAVTRLSARLSALNPFAAIMDGEALNDADWTVLANGLVDPLGKAVDTERFLSSAIREGAPAGHVCGPGCDHDHHHHHDHGQDRHHHHYDHSAHDGSVTAFSLTYDRPVPEVAIAMFVDLMRSAHAEKLLRMKAVVQTAEDSDRPLVLHGVQAIFHPPERLAAWPAGARRQTRLVIIGQGLEKAFVDELFRALCGEPLIDRPDRAALADNPLSLPSGF